MRIYFTIILLFIVCLFSDRFAYGQTEEESLHATLSLGYSHIYNYELNPSEKINGNLVRADVILTLKKFLFESDYQHIFVKNSDKYFVHNSIGYKFFSGEYLPKTYVLVSHIYANKFPQDGLLYNENHRGFGFGGLFRMNIEYLLNGDASFAVTYFPSDKIFYKNMQVGWDLKVIGISVGGIGIRVPDGRYYSGFIFQLRHKW